MTNIEIEAFIIYVIVMIMCLLYIVITDLLNNSEKYEEM